MKNWSVAGAGATDFIYFLTFQHKKKLKRWPYKKKQVPLSENLSFLLTKTKKTK